MIIENEGTYTLRYTATDSCGKTTTVDRELVVADRWGSIRWSDGTDEDIVAMVQAADQGKINLADYWSVGDERVVRLSAMEPVGHESPYAEQNVTLVLMNVGGKTLNTPTASGRTSCSFIVGMKDILNELGKINRISLNTGGWESCDRRTWCNSSFYNAVPSTLRPIFKQHLNKTANGGSDATAPIESVDYFAFPAEYEVFGVYSNSSSTYEANLTQFEWYQEPSNRIKLQNGSQANYWWERSPASANTASNCFVSASGNSAAVGTTNDLRGISPFGVI